MFCLNCGSQAKSQYFGQIFKVFGKISQRFRSNFLNILDKFLDEFGQFLKYVGHNLEDVDRNLFKLLKYFGQNPEDPVRNQYTKINPPPPNQFLSQIAPYYRVGTVWTFGRKITNISQNQTYYRPKKKRERVPT